jgi:hypothetical protein
MAVNKVIYGQNTLIDLTSDTVAARHLRSGYTAHDASGQAITGTLVQGEAGSTYQDENGFVVLDDEPGSSVLSIPLSVTSNGTYSASSGYAYTPVTVSVPGTAALLQSKTVTPTKATQVILPDNGEVNIYTITNKSTSTTVQQQSAPITVDLTNLVVGETYHITGYGSSSLFGAATNDWAIDTEIVFSEGVSLPFTYEITWGTKQVVSSINLYSTYINITFVNQNENTFTLTELLINDYSGTVYDGLSQVTVNAISSTYVDINDVATGHIIEANGSTASCVTIAAFAYNERLTCASFPLCDTIYTSAFVGCSSLSFASFPECTMVLSDAFKTCVKLSDIFFPKCTLIGQSAFYGCTSLSNVVFQSCSAINIGAFYNCTNLRSISFPVCTTIGSSAFQKCIFLSYVDFPECISIYNGAFSSCTNLRSVFFSKCSSIWGMAFMSCGNLENLSFPVCKNIGASAFLGSPLSSVYFPECTLIGGSAFNGCTQLSYISFPKCTTIDTAAFRSCTSLTTINFPECSSIGAWAFAGCSKLTDLSFPSCTYINNSAFASCSALSFISFPMCSLVGGSCFAYCYSLTTAIFNQNGSKLSIYMSAFANCHRLFSLYILGSLIASIANSGVFAVTPISNFTDDTNGQNGSIFVPASLYDSYISSTYWSVYSSRIVSLTDTEIFNVQQYGRHDP